YWAAPSAFGSAIGTAPALLAIMKLAYYLSKGVEELARPFALALAVVGTIVVVSMILYWRRPSVTSRAIAGETVGRGRWVILSRICHAPAGPAGPPRWS